MERWGLRFSLREFGGALGDLGTLLPLMVALMVINGLHPMPVLLLVGASYVGVGLFYRVAMPVQPLKAVSALSVSLRLSPGVISTSGLLIGFVLLGLAVSGLVKALYRLFPLGVVRGIQLGVAVLLFKAGVRLAVEPAPQRMENLTVAIVATGLLVLCLRSRYLPASLAVIGFGIGVGLYNGLPPPNPTPQFTLPSLPQPQELRQALLMLVLPQLPLTLGNSVFATADAARTYYGQGAGRVNPRNLLYSIGLMNLIAAGTGAMPLCHGSGGLTAHYRLGARTGGAPVMLGGLLILLALGLGGRAVPYLGLVSYPVLGVLLCFVGVQHALLAREFRGRGALTVILTIGAVTLLTGHLGIGFASGLALHYLLRLRLPALNR